jgi:murein L,D-transpeptidase YcbB/YkuD
VIRIRLQDFDGEPFANTEFELRVGSDLFNGTTDQEGKLEQRVPVQARQGMLKTAYGEWTLHIGELNPIDQTPDQGASGIQMRLRNLGFNPGPIDGIIGPQTQSAIQDFQKKCSLKVDGVCGPQTSRRLLEEHGS